MNEQRASKKDEMMKRKHAFLFSLFCFPSSLLTRWCTIIESILSPCRSCSTQIQIQTQIQRGRGKGIVSSMQTKVTTLSQRLLRGTHRPPFFRDNHNRVINQTPTERAHSSTSNWSRHRSCTLLPHRWAVMLTLSR